MINLRNGFTYLANIVMLSLAMGLFIYEVHPMTQFQFLSVICVVLGTITTLFYLC